MKYVMVFVLSAAFVIGALSVSGQKASAFEDPKKTAEVIRKLDEIIKNQQNLLSRVAEIEKQLQIIKVRATRA